MKIYLAGPMRGYPEFNFPAFYKAAEELRAKGHFVFNPAERDVEKYGKDVCKSETGDLNDVPKTIGFSLREALGADCQFICAEAEAIALLPGWEKSKGATAEHALSVALGHEVIKL